MQIFLPIAFLLAAVPLTAGTCGENDVSILHSDHDHFLISVRSYLD